MRHVRMLGLCLVAAFALAAVFAAGSASAQPEWGRCLSVVPSTGKAQKKGNYTEKNCQTVAVEKKGKPDHKGGYEWFGGTKALCMKQTEAKYRWKESECKTEDIKVKKKKGVVVSEEHAGKYALSTEVGLGEKFKAESGAAVLAQSVFGCEQEPSFYVGPRAGCVGEPGEEYNGELERNWTGYENSAMDQQVECTSEHASGEATGSDEVANVSVRFEGCTAFGIPVTQPGLPAGEIQLNPLKGRLGYIDKATHDVGVLLEPETAGGRFVTFEVLGGALGIAVGVGNASEGSFYEETGPGEPTGHDGIISPITPVNRMTHEFNQQYRIAYEEVECKAKWPTQKCWGERHETVGIQKNTPSSFEGGPLEALEDYLYVGSEPSIRLMWSPAGEELTNVNTVEGEAEIKA